CLAESAAVTPPPPSRGSADTAAPPPPEDPPLPSAVSAATDPRAQTATQCRAPWPRYAEPSSATGDGVPSAPSRRPDPRPRAKRRTPCRRLPAIRDAPPLRG